MSGVEGRVALVTGAGRGIGKAASLLLAERGARVMAVSRSKHELTELGMDYLVADLGDAGGCAQTVAETERRLGPVGILVCNHGIGSAHERVIWEQDIEVWDETMRINLDGPFHLSRLIVGGMADRGYGRVVFTSSTAGELAEREGSAYSALQARADRADAVGRPGRRAVRRDVERGAARLGAHRDGREVGRRDRPPPRHHSR